SVALLHMHMFLFSSIHRRPRSTLFPFTTLFRSSLADALAIERRWLAKAWAQAQTGAAQIELADGGTAAAFDWCDRLQQLAGHARSEEHTSELQSRENLVCRVLLEKKKKKKQKHK